MVPKYLQKILVFVHIVDDTVLLVNIEQEIELKNGAELKFLPGDIVQAEETIAVFDLFSEPIISEFSGRVKYVDILPGTTMREEINDETGNAEKKIVETGNIMLNPSLQIVDDNGSEMYSYELPFDSYLNVDNGQEVERGQMIAKMPKENVKTRDITGGLPRISKLFEAFNPKESAAVLAKVDGTVEAIVTKERGKTVSIKDLLGNSFEHSVPLGRHLFVRNGDMVRAGDLLCEGEINPHDILNILGETALQLFLINEIQEVYRLQGVSINDKHICVIIRQMMCNLEIVQGGDSSFIQGQTGRSISI